MIVRILREREPLEESIFGKKLNITFGEAVKAYLAKGGSDRFIGPLLGIFAERRLRKIAEAIALIERNMQIDEAHHTSRVHS